jgi:hypothetical protein
VIRLYFVYLAKAFASFLISTLMLLLAGGVLRYPLKFSCVSPKRKTERARLIKKSQSPYLGTFCEVPFNGTDPQRYVTQRMGQAPLAPG